MGFLLALGRSPASDVASPSIPLSAGRLLTTCGLVFNDTLGHDASELLTMGEKRCCFPKISEFGTFMVQKDQNFRIVVLLFTRSLRSVVQIGDADKEVNPLGLRPKQASLPSPS